MKPGNSSNTPDSSKPAKGGGGDAGKAKSAKADSVKSTSATSDTIKFVGGDGARSSRASDGADSKPAKAGPDVSEMYARELPKAAFPGRGAKDFRVFLDAAVHAQIAKHAGEDTSVEICGVLVGDWQTDDDGPYVSIIASIPGEAVANKLSEVTFTHETWAQIHKRMDADFADKSIIGWYHTHPNFGIFLSERDCFIHEHFFNGPGQVAYVVDPVRKEEGFFVWNKGKPVPAAFYWVGKEMRLAPPIEDDKREMRERSSSSSLRAESAAESERRSAAATAGRSMAEPPPMLTWVSNVLFGLCLFMLGFILSKYLVLSERTTMTDQLLFKYVLGHGLKPGLGSDLAIVNEQLASLASQSAQESMKATAGPVANSGAKWALMASYLADLQKRLDGMRTTYALSPQDEEIMQKANLGWLKPPPPPEKVEPPTLVVPGAATGPATSQSTTGPATTPHPSK